MEQRVEQPGGPADAPHDGTGRDAVPGRRLAARRRAGARAACATLELTTLLGEALGAADPPALEALQFPYRANDAWLGLRFPETLPDGAPFVARARTSCSTRRAFAAGAEIDPTNADHDYCGLLLDEWIEVDPDRSGDTGLAFHFDRPNSEAPQAILLATPPVHRGAWQWQDIVDTLHETLDFARLRAVEPAQLDETALAPLLPAVLSSVTAFPITATLNLAFNNNVHAVLAEGVQ